MTRVEAAPSQVAVAEQGPDAPEEAAQAARPLSATAPRGSSASSGSSAVAGTSGSSHSSAVPGAATRGSPDRQANVRAITGTVVLLGAVLLGFVVYLFGLSSLAESRAQNVMYKSFASTLSAAVAPVGPVAPGTPVAIVNVPSVGIEHLVVVEGTDASQLVSGPGHRRDTPLPGQVGVSVVYGRRATLGAPFADLSGVRLGDPITVTTGQGLARYVVAAFGTGAHPAKDVTANRLVLTTADSSFVPSSTVTVSADLVSKAQPSPGGLPALSDSEHSMRSGTGQAVLPLMMWGQVLVILAVVATFAVRRWSKWPAYICLAPVALAVLWNVYEKAALLLPNVY